LWIPRPNILEALLFSPLKFNYINFEMVFCACVASLRFGTKIKLPDNRKPQLASAEAEWWNKR
jgi:hypothetical protein